MFVGVMDSRQLSEFDFDFTISDTTFQILKFGVVLIFHCWSSGMFNREFFSFAVL